MRKRYSSILGILGLLFLLLCFALLSKSFLYQKIIAVFPKHCCEGDQILELQEPILFSDEVFELQFRLAQLGYYHGEVNGYYDSLTAQGVKDFQSKCGMEMTGKVDQALWEELGKDTEMILPVENKELKDLKGKLSIEIDLSRCRLRLLEDGQRVKEYTVAVGKPSTPSPVGEWKIISKSSSWGGGFGSRFMGLNVPWGIYGIHGTNKPYSIGQRMSAGCIRMYNKDVEELYSLVPVGTPVKIIGPYPQVKIREAMKHGSTGKDVLLLQKSLREKGFEVGTIDGRFGKDTEKAIRSLEHFYGLEEDGIVGGNELFFLGLW